MEYLSQKQIADKVGVTKQKIYRCIKLNHIKEAHSEVVKGNTVLMYDKQAIEQIEGILKGGDTASSEAHNKVHNEALNEAVLKQLDILSEQLKSKDKQIENILKGGDTASSEAHNEVHNEALNEAVLKQLDILNEQLKSKDKQIENLQKLLDQEQQLNAMHHEKILLLESKLEKSSTEPIEPDEHPKSFWTKIFKK